MKKKLVLGFILIFLSLGQFLFFRGSISPWIILIFIYFGMLGSALIFDSVFSKIYKKSVIDSLIRNKKDLIKFFIVSLIGTLLIELIPHWLGKLWIYPSWNYLIYTFFAFTGFVLYWLFIGTSYLATKSLIDAFKGGKEKLRKPFKFEYNLFPKIGFIGFVLLIISIYLTYSHYSWEIPFLQLSDLNQVTSSFVLPYYVIILFFLALWFIFEYFEWKNKKSSLISEILHEHLTPIISIIIGSFLLGIIVEVQNLTHYVYIYINWPLEQFTFIGLPITMFLAWPLHYILFLSLWRVFTESQSKEIWKGDRIR